MKMSQKIRQVSDLLKLPRVFITVINEPTYVEDIHRLIGEFAQNLPRTKKIHSVDVDLGRLKDNQYFVKKAYQILTNPNRPMDADSVQWRVLLVQVLEKKLNTQFQNTADFKKKIKAFLEGYQVRKKPPAERIKKARKKMKWTQKQLADHLGYKSHVTVAQLEKGSRAPAKRVFQWLAEAGM